MSKTSMKCLRLLTLAALCLPLALSAAPSTTAPTLSTSVIANDASTGTTLNKLAKLTSAGAAVSTATTDTDTAIGVVVANAGTTGSAVVANAGIVKCVFDGTATDGHFVQISSSTAGDCHDTGAATRPSSGGQVIGYVVAGGSGAGAYTIQLQIGNPIASGNVTGTGTSVAGNVPQLSNTSTTGVTDTGDPSAALPTSVGQHPGAVPSTATVTITIASPAVITWTANGLQPNAPVVFTNSGGALPTGITSGTTYFVVGSSITTNTFQIAISVANAKAGTSVNTSGSQSGTQTGTANSVVPTGNLGEIVSAAVAQGSAVANTSGAIANITSISLTPGRWRLFGWGGILPATTTSYTRWGVAIETANNAFTSTQTQVWIQSMAAVVPGVNPNGYGIGPFYVTITSNTSYFLNCVAVFTVSTSACYGNLEAERVN